MGEIWVYPKHGKKYMKKPDEVLVSSVERANLEAQQRFILEQYGSPSLMFPANYSDCSTNTVSAGVDMSLENLWDTVRCFGACQPVRPERRKYVQSRIVEPKLLT
jgi:hypothetical protein